MKDSQDWLDIEEILDNLWYEAAHDVEPIGSAVAKAKQAIKAHIKQEFLALVGEDESSHSIPLGLPDSIWKLKRGRDQLRAELRKAIESRYE